MNTTGIPSFEEFKKKLEKEQNTGNTKKNLEELFEDLPELSQSTKKQESQLESIDIATAVKNYIKNNKVKILIGTPCYGGLIHTGYFQSMMQLIVNLTKLGVEHEVLNIGNESLITRARNGIVAKFLSSDEYTHLMFIDADITFSWLSVIKLLLVGKDLSGGCYPKKSINWDKVKNRVQTNPQINTKELVAKSVDYVFNPIYYKHIIDGKEQIIIKLESNMAKVKDIATGFMMIRRNVFDVLRAKYPERKYKNNVAGYHSDSTAENFYTFFDTEIDEESRVYLSEDYLFCKLWRACGGELWMDLDTNLNHTGSMDFIGSLALNIGELDTLNADSITTQNTYHPNGI
jgi:hypothetical protein